MYENKEALVKALELIRASICSYAPGRFCDCKYGVVEAAETRKMFGNGCPEMRMVMAAINAMTKTEYKNLVLGKKKDKKKSKK